MAYKKSVKEFVIQVVVTTSQDTIAVQVKSHEIDNQVNKVLIDQVIPVVDERVREGLIAMGWTPPQPATEKPSWPKSSTKPSSSKRRPWR